MARLLRPRTMQSAPARVGLSIADLNGDGKLDVAVGNQGDGTISVLLGNGDGTLQTQTVYAAVPGANYLAVADFNGDGRSDLAVCFGDRPNHRNTAEQR